MANDLLHVHKRGEHDYTDGQLSNAKILADAMGVSGAAVSKAIKAGRIKDAFEDSSGKVKYYIPLASEQFHANKDPSKVTTATKGQKAMGLSNFGARAIAQRKPGFVEGTAVPLSDEEIVDFAESRARREKYNADLAKYRSEEQAGLLVNKELAGNKVKEIAASVKDRLLTIHLKVAIAVMAPLENALIEAGFEVDGVRAALSNSKIESVIGETIRKNVVESLRDIVQKEIDGFIG